MARPFLIPIDLNKNELQNARLQNLASAPASPVAGQVYYDTVSNAFFYYNGTLWVNAVDRARHTGTQLAATISDLATTVQGYRLNQFTVPNANVPMGGFKLTGLSTAPNASGDSAEYSWVLGQVQSSAAGITSRPPVRVVATTNLSLTGAATIDGVAVATNDRVLATAQTTASQNGVYVANTAGAWSRAVSEDQSSEMLAGSLWFVTEGTANVATQWRQATTGAITLGTTSLSIVQFGAAPAYTASNGVLLSGNAFSAVADPVALGGITITAAGIKVDATEVARHFSFTLNTSATSYTVTHNLGTQDVWVAVSDTTANRNIVEADCAAPTVNTVTVGFAVAPSANAYRVTVIG